MGFQFRDHLLRLDLAGQEFVLTEQQLTERSDKQLMDKMNEMANKVTEIEKNEGVAEAMRVGCEELAAFLDEYLGEKGAMARVFGDRPVSFYDLVDIVVYISDEVQSFFKDRIPKSKISQQGNRHPAYNKKYGGKKHK